MTKALLEEYAEPDRPAFGPRLALAESLALKRPGSVSARRKVRLGVRNPVIEFERLVTEFLS